MVTRNGKTLKAKTFYNSGKNVEKFPSETVRINLFSYTG